jgi:pimeloyl-ACP methyl ester carboxylesterase
MTDRTRTVSANGVAFACRSWGDGDRLALCLHGFPDDAGSLAPVAERLADAGYTAVAPYMRGYGPTGGDPDDDYRASTLGADAVALADALDEADGYEDAVLVGHDWGAVAGYAAARVDPDRFDRLVTMAVPPRFAAEIWNHPRQFLRSWYIWLFQFPVAPERLLRRSDLALIEVLWNLWSPGWDYDRDRLAAVKDTFRAGTTVENALAYYRQFVRPLLVDVMREGPPDPADSPPIEVPTLVVAGEDDGCIGVENFDAAGPAVDAECRVVAVRDAGHFMHRERPEVVSEAVERFLAG